MLVRLLIELDELVPEIFGHFPIQNFWCYKVLKENPLGVMLHADQAAVNLNVWLTPEDGHISGGGTQVYSAVPELNAGFQKFNAYQVADQMRRQLASLGSMKTVPFQQNRALVFNSDKWHGTEPDFHFEDAFGKERVVLTILWGNRMTPDERVALRDRVQHALQQLDGRSEL